MISLTINFLSRAVSIQASATSLCLAILRLPDRFQNTTFGGIQGFTRMPSTHWFDDSGEFAGIVHQERDWTYVLVEGAGHLVPQYQPGRVC